MDEIRNWLETTGNRLVERRGLSGGCVSKVALLLLENGQRVLCKQGGVGSAQLLAESASLRCLAEHGTIKIPEVLYTSETLLLLDYIESGVYQASTDQIIAEGLTQQHRHAVGRFGFSCDTYCGSTLQPNHWQQSGYQFYAEQRYNHMARLCYEKGLLTVKELNQVEKLSDKLERLIPVQPAVLLHGDLWSGNCLIDKQGQPWLIDPACYFGWAEAELSMMTLFGGFNQQVFSIYEELNSQCKGWQGRKELYNLWHLLNHLYLFGESYHSSVKAVIDRYV